MILEKHQIQRYMRHIVMPEISGKGQKNLIESRVIVYGHYVSDVAIMGSYLAAAGVGQITIALSDFRGFEELYNNLLDLNPEVSVYFTELNQLIKAKTSEYAVRIVLGDLCFVCDTLQQINAQDFPSPIVWGCIHSYLGCLGIIKNAASFESLLEGLTQNDSFAISDAITKSPFDPVMAGFIGTLCATETIKEILGLQSTNENIHYFDLLSMEFNQFSVNLDGLHRLFHSFMESKLLNNVGLQKTLANLKVLIVGAGGLGSPVALALANAGIGTIGLVDYDLVDLSNLNRQILHSTSRIGMPKVKSAKEFLRKAYPSLKVIEYGMMFTQANALDIIKDFDIIVDGLDNLPTRYLLNDACCILNKPFIEAGVLGFIGLITTIIPGKGHCYRCIFPETEKTGPVPSCAETGVLGPVPGTMGFLQAAEVIKYAAGLGKLLSEGVILFDSLDMDISIPDFKRDLNCPVCGTNPSIAALGQYVFKCSSK